MDINTLLDNAKIILLNSNVYISDSESLLDEDIFFQPELKVNKEESEKETLSLINYIKSKIDITIPDNIIRTIIDAQIEFYLNKNK